MVLVLGGHASLTNLQSRTPRLHTLRFPLCHYLAPKSRQKPWLRLRSGVKSILSTILSPLSPTSYLPCPSSSSLGCCCLVVGRSQTLGPVGGEQIGFVAPHLRQIAGCD